VEPLRDELFFRAAWLVPFTALVVFVLGLR
jgi:hypothetical protein